MSKPIVRIIVTTLAMLWGAQACAEDLIDIYNLAVENDPQFQAQALTLKAEQQGPASARAQLLPDVRLFAARARVNEDFDGTGSFGVAGSSSHNNNEYGASVTQTLYNREQFLNYEQAKLREDVARIAFHQAQQDLVLRVVDRYLGVLAAQDDLELAIAERRAVREQLDLARSRLEVGLGTATDLNDARARFELTEAQEIRARQALEDAHQLLRELVGQRIEQLAPLREDSPLEPPTPAQSDIWVQRAQANNLALLTTTLNEVISKREVSRQKARRMPNLDLVVRHNVVDADGSVTGGSTEQTSTTARLELEIPIFQGGGISADSRAAAFRYQAAEQNTEAALRAATRGANSAYRDVTTSMREAEALDQAVSASEDALESRKESFEAGLITNLDVLDAQRDLFQARRDYLDSRYQYITDMLELHSVTGELDVTELESMNNWLE